MQIFNKKALTQDLRFISNGLPYSHLDIRFFPLHFKSDAKFAFFSNTFFYLCNILWFKFER